SDRAVLPGCLRSHSRLARLLALGLPHPLPAHAETEVTAQAHEVPGRLRRGTGTESAHPVRLRRRGHRRRARLQGCTRLLHAELERAFCTKRPHPAAAL